MDSDRPRYYGTLCPVDILGCDSFDAPEAVIDHVVAEHDPRIVATVLVRETYINRRLWDLMEGMPHAIEREIDAMVPDPIADDQVEVDFGD